MRGRDAMHRVSTGVARFTTTKAHEQTRNGERGAALAVSIIVLLVLLLISASVLAVASTEAGIVSSDIRRTHAFYAGSAALEKMSNDFLTLFRRRSSPTAPELNAIAAAPPPELVSEGFNFAQTLSEDTARLAEMRATQGISGADYPRLNIAQGPFAGLWATVVPYRLSSVATHTASGTQVGLERTMNHYLIPLFQFGIFSNEDLEFHPGPLLTVNGRVHSNQNIYALRNVRFLSKVTAAGELVYDAWRDGRNNIGGQGADNVWLRVNSLDVKLSAGSVQRDATTPGGPNFPTALAGARGFFSGSPDGVANPSWETTSVLPADGTANRFGGQLLTRTTGATVLQLPLQTAGHPAYEIIKRPMPDDDTTLQEARYANKASVRITLDDETAGTGAANVAGIPAGQGVMLSAFDPLALGGGNALSRVSDAGTYLDPFVLQDDPASGATLKAETVRGVRSYAVSDTPASNMGVPKSPNGAIIPAGAGLTGRILIQIVAPDGTVRDVTQEILSLGMTVGEPNAVIHLQRPLWAGYLQGSRDRAGNNLDLVTLGTQTGTLADGEINSDTPTFDATLGYLTTPAATFDDDAHDAATPFVPLPAIRNRRPTGTYNQIVPINFYNVREGWWRSTLGEYDVYERGMTQVVELNMKNLARWVDGVYDANLLSGTSAVSTNINGTGGYTVYFSDRRGDRVKLERNAANANINTTNGLVDYEDIYGADGILQAGEDVITQGFDVALNQPKAGSLQKDTNELPDAGAQWSNLDRAGRARDLLAWTNPNNYFRRALRVVNAERLVTTQGSDKLTTTKGLTVAAENPLIVWGNYNTSGVASLPATGSTLNDGSFLGAQVPASLVSDALFPLSRTWFDALSVLYPEGCTNGAAGLTSGYGTIYREADAGAASVSEGTAVRAGVIAGTTLSALSGAPGRDAAGGRLSGGVINFPRFSEIWSGNTEHAWSFTGSFVPLFRSTQALAQWENSTPVIYIPPRRNWSFDDTFRQPNRLPPSTPLFSYIEPTGFREIF